MSVRKKSTFRKFSSKVKRGGKRTVIAITSLPFMPIRLTGNLIKVVGENIEGSGEQKIYVGKPMGENMMVWKGRAYKLVGGSINMVGKTRRCNIFRK